MSVCVCVGSVTCNGSRCNEPVYTFNEQDETQQFFFTCSFIFFLVTFDQLNFSSISFSFRRCCFSWVCVCMSVLLLTRRLILSSTMKTPLSSVYVSGIRDRKKGESNKQKKSKCDDAFCSTDYDLEFHIHSRKIRYDVIWCGNSADDHIIKWNEPLARNHDFLQHFIDMMNVHTFCQFSRTEINH